MLPNLVCSAEEDALASRACFTCGRGFVCREWKEIIGYVMQHQICLKIYI